MISPKPCTKNNPTRFLHQLEGTLEEASKAETIPSLETISNKLKTLKGKLTKGMGKRQQFQDLIIKCETLVKQKLRNAKIKNKCVSPSLNKTQSQKYFVLSPKYNSSDSTSNKLTKATATNFQDPHETFQYSDLNDKLSDIRREIKKQKQQKYKLKHKVDQLQQGNKLKESELQHLRDDMAKLNLKVQKLQQVKKEEIPSSVYAIHKSKDLNQSRGIKNTKQSKNMIKQISPSVRTVQKDHNLYVQQKQALLRRFQQRISQKNTIISNLQRCLSVVQSENIQLKANSALKVAHHHEGLQSIKLMLKSSNDKLQTSIKQKSELKEVISQLQIKNEVYMAEIDKLIITNTALKKQLQRNQKILEHKIHEQKRDASFMRNNLSPKLYQNESDKIILFERLDEKEKEITLLKQSNFELKHEKQIMNMTLKAKEDKILQLEQLLYKRQIEKQSMNVQLARAKSEDLNNTFKNIGFREEAKRVQKNVNKSLDITRKLNALQGIRSIIRKFPHGH